VLAELLRQLQTPTDLLAQTPFFQRLPQLPLAVEVLEHSKVVLVVQAAAVVMMEAFLLVLLELLVRVTLAAMEILLRAVAAVELGL